MELDPLAYCNPEILMFPSLKREFDETGNLDPAGLYMILIWKAERAKTKHRKRLIQKVRERGTGHDFSAAAQQIGCDLKQAKGSEQRLECLMVDWAFRLPTATAILSVLYPNRFTIYDVRVCEQLQGFHNLGQKVWSPRFWEEYLQFVEAVRSAAHADRPGMTLRDCDRWLWGKDKQRGVQHAIREIV